MYFHTGMSAAGTTALGSMNSPRRPPPPGPTATSAYYDAATRGFGAAGAPTNTGGGQALSIPSRAGGPPAGPAPGPPPGAVGPSVFDGLLRRVYDQHNEEIRVLKQEIGRLATELSRSRADIGATNALLQEHQGPPQRQGERDMFFSPLPSQNGAWQLPGLPGAVLESGQAPSTLADRSTAPPALSIDVEGSDAKVQMTMAAAHLRMEVSDLDAKNRRKMRQRLRAVLTPRIGADGKEVVGVREVQAVMMKKRVQISDESIAAVLSSFMQIEKTSVSQTSARLNGDEAATDARKVGDGQQGDIVAFHTFTDLLMMPNLASCVSNQSVIKDVGIVQRTFLTKDVDEVICKVTATNTTVTIDGNITVQPGSSSLNLNPEESRVLEQKARRKAFILRIVNNVVYTTIILSIAKFGVQMDRKQGWLVWDLLEGLFAFIFVLELVIKNALLGPREYLCGRDRRWNWLDIFITCVAVLDSCIMIFTYQGHESEEFGGSSAARFTLLIRGLRLARVARLVKMLRHPFLRDLASMLAGLFIGAPWLIWVITLLTVFIYMISLGFRSVVGPQEGEDSYIFLCGHGDNLNPERAKESGYDSGDACPIHKIFGEEFFETVPKAMFTVFRCLIGDCSTTLGQSLVVHLAKGYGWRFYIVYCAGMTITIFGLFNIITAMFVEATLSGLKNNEVVQRRAKLYEQSYVRKKLTDLVERVYEILGETKRSSPKASPKFTGPTFRFQASTGDADEACADDGITMSEQEYATVINDPVVTILLDELDVDTSGREGLFDMFDSDADGRVSIPEMLETIVKMRGDLKKADIVANFLALRSLQEKFAQFELILLANQRQMMENQRAILNSAGGDTGTGDYT